MKQSHQDDTWEELAAFAQSTYINLLLAAKMRRLTDDEISLLQKAARLAVRLHPVGQPVSKLHQGEHG